MLLNRRSVLAGALLPLLPSAGVGEHELLALGAQLEVLQRRAMTQRKAGLAGDGWQRWNEAVVESVALAEAIGRSPARDAAGFAVRLRAICCEWEDDLEAHQLQRLRALAREMGRAEQEGEIPAFANGP